MPKNPFSGKQIRHSPPTIFVKKTSLQISKSELIPYENSALNVKFAEHIKLIKLNGNLVLNQTNTNFPTNQFFPAKNFCMLNRDRAFRHPSNFVNSAAGAANYRKLLGLRHLPPNYVRPDSFFPILILNFAKCRARSAVFRSRLVSGFLRRTCLCECP